MITKHSQIIIELRDKTGIITLSNPEKKNALSSTLLREMKLAFEFLKEGNVRVVIIRADKEIETWSSGHDIDDLPGINEDPRGFENPLEENLRMILEYNAPVIAMVEGGVWGGACDLVLACDLAVGTPESTFALTPAKLGVPYNATGILNIINRIGLSHAKEMFYTARPINAETAFHFGIINHIVPSDKIEKFTYSLAREISSNSPLSISIMKEQFRILTGSVHITPDVYERIEALRKKVYKSGDYKEGLNAFREKRKPDFRGE